MADKSSVKVNVEINCICLGKILDAFNGPLNEEQAWSLGHQCAKFLGQSLCQDGDKRRDFDLAGGVDSVWMRKDGTVTIDELEVPADRTDDEHFHQVRERELVDALGRVIYQSLDYGFHEEEERELSHPLETLIDAMTISEEADDTDNGDDKHSNDTLNSDEGIEDGTCSEDEDETRRQSNSVPDGKITSFDMVLQACRRHLPDPAVAPNHYQAVCRALVNEVQELTTFLERIADSKHTLHKLKTEDVLTGFDSMDGNVDNLQPREWARIWMMVLQTLRHGVKLKKVDREFVRAPIEFELTPYEILMDDIRSRRYQLNKIMVDGDIPVKVKKEAHDIILDFIRSRPPLKAVRCHSWSESKLMDKPIDNRLRKISIHERLLQDIRAQPKLLPVSQRVLAKKPKHPRRRRYGSGGDSSSVSSDIDSDSFDSMDDSPELPKRKLKAEVILDWSDDDDMLEAVTIPDKVPTQSTTSYDSPGDIFVPPSVQNNMYVYPERPKEVKPTIQTPKPKPTVMPKPPSKKLSVMNMPTLSLDSDPGSPDFSSLIQTSMDDLTSIPAMQDCLFGDDEDDEPISPLKESKPFERNSPRRHSIGACQSQRRSMMRKSRSGSPMAEFYQAPAFLSLTVDEVIHIRSVLIKAELENLRVNPKMYKAVSEEKVCFSCKNKFGLFKKKARCSLCQRLVCSVCCKKMALPRGHFLQIPVDALSPATPKNRRRKKRPSAYRGPETAEKFRSISDPPTPAISPIHIPKFWRLENRTQDDKDDVCVQCKDFLVNAMKSANKTPTATPNRTPTGSQQSTPTRKFSLGPAPVFPGLHPRHGSMSSQGSTLHRQSSVSSQGTEKSSSAVEDSSAALDIDMESIPDNIVSATEDEIEESDDMFEDDFSYSAAKMNNTPTPGEISEESMKAKLSQWGLKNNNDEVVEATQAAPEVEATHDATEVEATHAAGDAPSVEITTEKDITPTSEDKPWGLNNDDEELEEVRRSSTPQPRIPYVI